LTANYYCNTFFRLSKNSQGFNRTAFDTHQTRVLSVLILQRGKH